MKNTIYIIAAFAMVTACNPAAETGKETNTVEKITEEEALELLHTWTNAYLKGDAEPLKEVLDESWVYSGSSDGSTSDKQATIEEFSNADYFFEDITYENLDVRLFGDIAVVRGMESMVILGSSKQDTTILSLRFTDVYQKKDGKVKAISTHSSPIE